MDVRRVACDEDPADAVPVDQPVADPEHRGPAQVVRGGRFGGEPVEHRLDVLQLGVRPASIPCCTLAVSPRGGQLGGASIDIR